MNNSDKYILGNWKSNKSSREILSWFSQISKYQKEFSLDIPNNLKIVIFPPLIYLSEVNRLIKKFNLPFLSGAQDVSPYSEGAYTGAVTAKMLAEYSRYVLIGHSERRSLFKETDDILIEKIERAKEAELEVVYCIPGEDAIIPNNISIIAYEPIWAIGTGKAETPLNVNKIAKKLVDSGKTGKYVYGGSVDQNNIVNFMSMDYISGVLPGGASLDPKKFWEMIDNTVKILEKCPN